MIKTDSLAALKCSRCHYPIEGITWLRCPRCNATHVVPSRCWGDCRSCIKNLKNTSEECRGSLTKDNR